MFIRNGKLFAALYKNKQRLIESGKSVDSPIGEKMGDLNKCRNCRGITFLSVPPKLVTKAE